MCFFGVGAHKVVFLFEKFDRRNLNNHQTMSNVKRIMSNKPTKKPFNGKSAQWNRRGTATSHSSFYHPYHYQPPPPTALTSAQVSKASIESNMKAPPPVGFLDPRKFAKAIEFPSFPSLEEALEALNRRDGGVMDTSNRRCIQSQGTESRNKECLKIHKYKCGRQKCLYTAQIRQCDTFVFAIYKRPNTGHNHVVRAEIQTKGETRQIPHGLIKAIDAHIAKESINGISIHRITPKQILLHALGCIKHEPSLAEHYRCYLTDGSFRDQLSHQLRTLVTCRRQKNVTSLLGTNKIQTQHQLQSVLSIWQLNIPAGYVPRSNYVTAEELASALGLTAESMLVHDLSHGVAHDRYKAIATGQKNRALDEHNEKMELSFFVHSPTQLFQLLSLAKRRKGTRQLTVDGTRGACQLLTTLIILGSNSVRYRKCASGKHMVTSSLRPIAFIHAGGERLFVHVQTLYELRRLCFQLFGIPFAIDWGTSDHATAFVHAHLQFHESPQACDDLFWKPEAQGAEEAVMSEEDISSDESSK